MPNDPESKPTTLDYQSVGKDRRRIPAWLVVFLVGFVVGVTWVLAIWCYFINYRTIPNWVLGTVSPAVVRMVFDQWDLASIEKCRIVFIFGVSYGLLALSGYAVYRGLRRVCGGSDA